MSRIIPVTINELSMAEAFRFYRDELKLHVHPVWGPWATKESYPGKKPFFTGWWERDPQDCNLAKFFGGNGKCYNIGCAPKNAFVVVDLDSKADMGESVRKFLADNPDCIRGPWHETHGGAHLVFICRDVPEFMKDDGKKPSWQPRFAELLPGVTAELFYTERSNIVLPPSVHVEGFTYRWAAFGEVPEVSWEWLQSKFKFEGPVGQKDPEIPKKNPRWYKRYNGDLQTLDLLGMLETLGHPAELTDADDNKYSILCPWHEKHGEKGKTGTSTVVWQHSDRWPGFRCLHAHCAEQDLETLLNWAENKEPGIVDRFCAKSRVYDPTAIDEEGRPQVIHPGEDRLISEVHTELGTVIGPKHSWFKRIKQIVVIDKVPSGFVYSRNPDTEYKVEAYTTGFRELSAQEARSNVERYVIPGVLRWDMVSAYEFVKKSFPSDFCLSLVNSDHLRVKLPEIVRVLTVPVPIAMEGKLVFPNPGYDTRFGTFLVTDAPKIREMSLKQAIKVLATIHAEFPFTTDQSRVHAIARLLTPFARGLIGWTTRVPLWFYIANRPRAGKDYLAIIPLLIYEGYGFEDLPIGKDSEETRKRIIAAARNGRHFMHFSNCQGYLQDQYFCQVITAPHIASRNLGATEASNDLQLPNEMEFSLSANVGFTYRTDIEDRIRKIELAYFQEEANARKFRDPFLHQTIKEHRATFLSAIAAIFRHWAAEGFPKGPTVFTSFPKWAEVIGGVMLAAELGDPCLSFEGEYDTVLVGTS